MLQYFPESSLLEAYRNMSKSAWLPHTINYVHKCIVENILTKNCDIKWLCCSMNIVGIKVGVVPSNIKWKFPAQVQKHLIELLQKSDKKCM